MLHHSTGMPIKSLLKPYDTASRASGATLLPDCVQGMLPAGDLPALTACTPGLRLCPRLHTTSACRCAAALESMSAGCLQSLCAQCQAACKYPCSQSSLPAVACYGSCPAPACLPFARSRRAMPTLHTPYSSACRRTARMPRQYSAPLSLLWGCLQLAGPATTPLFLLQPAAASATGLHLFVRLPQCCLQVASPATAPVLPAKPAAAPCHRAAPVRGWRQLHCQ